MIITRTENQIIINNPSTFVARHILDSGQMFRYRFTGECWEVLSLDKICWIYEDNDIVRIATDDVDYFYNYFDLDFDYDEIINKLNNDYKLDYATIHGRGIRILRQDPLETIINFIISSNNNIPRIKGIINKLCQLGKGINGNRAFPTLDEMYNADIGFYNSLGAGYRAEYLYKTVNMIKHGFDIDIVNQVSTDDARVYLNKLCGVGPKVADCILLFGYHRMDVFPVDTWIAKVYQDECGLCNDSKKMNFYLVNKYGNLSGYAQQYLFYYKRENI